MSWIKLREDLHDDPAVVTIADRCGVSVWHAVGVVARVWAWAGRLSADGRVPHAKPSMIDTITHTPGLAEAMQSVGWLLVGDSELRFPKWDRHNGEAAKARAMDAERKRIERSGRSKPPRPESVQEEPDARPEKSGQFSDQRRGEEKREEKPSPTPPDAGGGGRRSKVEWAGSIPEQLKADPAFQPAWKAWLEHRANGGKGGVLTQAAGDAALAELVTWGPGEAVRGIRHAIASNYQAITPAPRAPQQRPAMKPRREPSCSSCGRNGVSMIRSESGEVCMSCWRSESRAMETA